MTFYIKTIIIAIIILFSFEASAQQRGQGQNDEILEVPSQIKPKRLQLIHRVANQLIEDEFAFKEVDEFDSILMELIREREIQDTRLINRNIDRNHRVINLNFEPNQIFENINLSYGYTTTLVFLDKNGNAWDIYDYSVGDSDIIAAEFRRGNIITLNPQRHSGITNLTIMFKGARMPVSIDLGINADKVDYITTLYIDGSGNNSAEERTISLVGGSGSDNLSYLAKFDGNYMSDILANVVPDGFNEKDAYINNEVVSKRDYRFFQKDNFLYVRTRHRPHHPEPLMIRNSSDGETKVYKIPYMTFPLFVMDGKITTLHIR